MRRNSKIVAALVGGLLVIGCTTAVAAGTSTPVECDITDNTLTCPLPEPPPPVTETQTVTQTPDPVTVTETATTTVSVPAGPETLFGDTVPANPADADADKVELGVKFKPGVDGVVTGIRFYKGAGNTGAHTGSLWSGTIRVATVTFANETDTGWQQAKFATPVIVKAGTEYVASYLAPVGHYAGDGGYAWPKVSGNLTASGSLYKYGGGRPTETFGGTNYYVDVLFLATGNPPATTTAPTTPATTAATIPETTAPVTTTPVTTAPTTTTTQPPTGACVGAANTPGGPDPWGGCWPGPQNTGYPQGLPGDTRTPVTLTPYSGPTTIRSCGVVIDSKIVPQDLLIEAGNGTDLTKPCVTIRNSLVKGVVFAEQRSHGPVLIQDTEVVPSGLSWWENIGRSNFIAERVNSHGSQGVIKCDDNCVARDNWVHGMELGKAYHYNAFGGNGSSNFRIEHNWASCGDWSATEPGVDGDAGCSAAIGFYGDFAQNRDITITRNYLVSTFPGEQFRQAGYCLNPGYYSGKPYPDTKNIAVTDNVFARGGSGKCGVYGPTNSLNKVGAPNGNVWSGNVFDDGTVINRPEE